MDYLKRNKETTDYTETDEDVESYRFPLVTTRKHDQPAAEQGKVNKTNQNNEERNETSKKK